MTRTLLLKKYFTKDVGHEGCILQPFNENPRDPDELILGAQIMLEIANMVSQNVYNKQIKLN